MAGLALSSAAQACTATVQAPIHVDKDGPGYSDRITLIADGGANLFYSGCAATHDLDVRLEGADLRWVMDFNYDAFPLTGPLPLYETGPESPLIGFATAASVVRPLRLGVNTFPQQYPQVHSVVLLFVFSRDGRTKDVHTTASIHMSAAAYPTLDATVPVSIQMRFAPTTCPLQDASEVLQDVATTELGAPGDTAKERQVAIRMACGIEVPHADMVLTDAGDPANTGSLLTPTADSSAEGVRVQLLREGTEVQFGNPWFFNPGSAGTHDIEFTARYMRTSGPFEPGLIKGEALLSVDYW